MNYIFLYVLIKLYAGILVNGILEIRTATMIYMFSLSHIFVSYAIYKLKIYMYIEKENFNLILKLFLTNIFFIEILYFRIFLSIVEGTFEGLSKTLVSV